MREWTEREALAWAIALIESYQLDIRQRGLDKEGFCQGPIYLETLPRLKKALNQQPGEVLI